MRASRGSSLSRVVGVLGLGLALAATAATAGCGSAAEDEYEDENEDARVRDAGGEGGTGGTGPSTPTSISATEICPTFIADACRAVFECPELAGFVEYPDEATCRKDLPCRGLADFEAELEAGYLTWDAEKAADCHDFLLADLCGAADALLQQSLQGVLALCPDAPAAPQQQAEDPCLQDLDCVGVSDCVVDQACGGTCTPLGDVGDVCVGSNDCADELSCYAGLCTEEVVVGVGEPCLPERCDDTSTCDLDQTLLDFVCVPLAPQGQTCGSDLDCLGELNCLETEPDVSTCEPLQERGGVCTWDSDCVDGLACIEAKCGDQPALGEECNSYLFGGHNCAEPNICSDGVCKAPRQWGETCDGTGEVCAEGICENGTCAQRRENGEVCELSSECRFRSCIDGRCVDPISCRPQ
ncbi:MAG TPA: Dickkopf N-terminal cysteine-rich domain-containing protein [Polyangiaceae bacterium]|nr:Dickkopf N-terminal cysteine-rich domain-containing protein [Polyangiaceae bacterium]